MQLWTSESSIVLTSQGLTSAIVQIHRFTSSHVEWLAKSTYLLSYWRIRGCLPSLSGSNEGQQQNLADKTQHKKMEWTPRRVKQEIGWIKTSHFCINKFKQNKLDVKDSGTGVYSPSLHMRPNVFCWAFTLHWHWCTILQGFKINLTHPVTARCSCEAVNLQFYRNIINNANS